MMVKLLMDAKQNEVKEESMRLTIEFVSCGGPVSYIKQVNRTVFICQ